MIRHEPTGVKRHGGGLLLDRPSKPVVAFTSQGRLG
jgi:hypothetical protein